MKHLIPTIIAVVLVTLSACDRDNRGKVQADTQPRTEADYNITFLFEVDGVKVYRFCDRGNTVYFTNANGKTQYDYTTHNGKTTTHHRVESINNNTQTTENETIDHTTLQDTVQPRPHQRG